ncbi:MAG: Stp1/IreP family PP2C-type Ser/Thr phosphatase [Maledivibacter sp.]|jgi:protein phosphatase|nr:Stp1/IreP family PP2C-type Ser/Thr phosphatase [Maledivibacter sp.]
MEWASKTDIGRIRSKNEDSLYVDQKHMRIFIVADGMGGHNAGEVASKMAIEQVSESIKNKFDSISTNDEAQIKRVIEDAIYKGNKEIYNQSLSHNSWDGMGTTITMALFIDHRLYFAHVGDSRAYMLRQKELTQLTEDHTLVSELMKNGSITEVEAKTHPKRNVITKALGTEISPIPDILSVDVDDGDVIILCTDGLTNMVDNYLIKNSFLNNSNLQDSCDFLVDEANNRGGFDNITLIAIRYRHS